MEMTAGRADRSGRGIRLTCIAGEIVASERSKKERRRRCKGRTFRGLEAESGLIPKDEREVAEKAGNTDPD
ncbi:MAG: hypothetical protein ACLS7Z_09960 [Christensenellales bacterium]